MIIWKNNNFEGEDNRMQQIEQSWRKLIALHSMSGKSTSKML